MDMVKPNRAEKIRNIVRAAATLIRSILLTITKDRIRVAIRTITWTAGIRIRA